MGSTGQATTDFVTGKYNKNNDDRNNFLNATLGYFTGGIYTAADIADRALIQAPAQQRADAKTAAATLQAQQQNLATQAQAQIMNTENAQTQNAVRDAARARQNQTIAGSAGVNSTILTSPLGVTGQAPQPVKTLLGS